MNAPFGFYEPPTATTGRPAVIFLFRIYATVSALAYLGAGLGVFWMRWVINVDRPPIPTLFFVLMTTAFAAFGALHVVAAAAPFRPWGWALGVAALGLGCLSGFFVFAIPLLVYWLRPQCRAAFMRM